MIDTLGRGKRSITVNLKKEEGISIVRKLCKKADVLLEPFRPGWCCIQMIKDYM